MRERLLAYLLFFLERPSVTGEEKELCDDLEARITASPTAASVRGSQRAVSLALSTLISSSPKALTPNIAPYSADDNPIIVW